MFLLRLGLKKLAECPFWIASDNQAFFFRAALRFLFGFRHCLHDKLYTSRLGFKKVPRTGIEPVRLDHSHPIASRACLPFQNRGTSAECRGEGWLDAQLASTWFGPLNAALSPFSRFPTLRSLTRFCISAKYADYSVKDITLGICNCGRILNERASHTGDCDALKITRNHTVTRLSSINPKKRSELISALNAPPDTSCKTWRLSFVGTTESLNRSIVLFIVPYVP